MVAEQNLKGFRGLTFDAFGALFDGGPMNPPSALARILGAQGKATDPHALEGSWREAVMHHQRTDPFITFRDVLRRSFEEVLSSFALTADLDVAVDDAMDDFSAAKVHSEVPRVLQEFESDVPLAVISNMDTAVLLEVLHRNGLSFNFVITSDEEQRYKPDAALFRRAVRYIGLPAEHILHVGDSYDEDVVGAASVGMPALLIHRAGTRPVSQGQAKGIVRDLREVRQFLLRSWQGE